MFKPFLLLLLITLSFSQNSGTLDFRAHKAFKNGSLLKTERLWISAYKAAQKEGHLEQKVLILANLTELYYLQNLNPIADSLFKVLKSFEAPIELLTQLKMKAQLNSNQCSNRPIPDGLFQVNALLNNIECSLWNNESPQQSLTQLNSLIDEGTGQFHIAAGWMALYKSDDMTVIKNWTKAIDIARKQGRFFDICKLNWFLGLIHKKNKRMKLAALHFRSSLEVAARLKTPLLYYRAAKSLLTVTTDLKIKNRMKVIQNEMPHFLSKATFHFPM